jgi:hypothetical protein
MSRDTNGVDIYFRLKDSRYKTLPLRMLPGPSESCVQKTQLISLPRGLIAVLLPVKTKRSGNVCSSRMQRSYRNSKIKLDPLKEFNTILRGCFSFEDRALSLIF